MAQMPGWHRHNAKVHLSFACCFKAKVGGGLFCGDSLRGPVAILFISRDTCSDTIAKLFRASFLAGYRTIIARYVAKWGIAQMCLCETK